jgi:hypothetical protein
MMKNFFVPVLLIIVVLQFVLLRLGRDDGDAYPRVFVEDSVYIVETVDTDMQDDTVRAVKYRLELLADEFGQWSVADQSSTWACWPGRGHEEFGGELCE